MNKEWGPLAGLIGEWEGDTDRAFKHSKNVVFDTSYREVCTMKPFGLVENGSESLYGLDYKSVMWSDDEENPFHTEVAYWPMDVATDEVMKGCVVPRGITVLAGGMTTADSQNWTMTAAIGPEQYAIGESWYLAANASSRSHEVTVTVGEDTFSYDQVATSNMNEFAEPFAQTDVHTLRKVRN